MFPRYRAPALTSPNPFNFAYVHPVVKEWLGVEKLLSLDAYKDYYGMDDINSILDVNYKVCRDVMCPANKDADEPGAKFVGGNEHAVVTPDSFKNELSLSTG